MRKIWCIGFFLFFTLVSALAQKKLFTKSGIISFYSKTKIEKIEAVNKKTLAVLDFEKNKIEFSVLIKGFEFEKALMQEHFNENYLESDKFPKAIFKGKFNDPNWVMVLNENKTQTVNVKGDLTLHGITRSIDVKAVLTVKDKMISASSEFIIKLSDYNIKIPSLVANNISKDILVKINIPTLKELK